MKLEPRTRRSNPVDWAHIGTHPTKRGLTEKVKLAILERDGFTCAYCDDDADEVDHIVPWSIDYDDSPMNLVACCHTCNLIAGARLFANLGEKRTHIRKIRKMPKWKSRLLRMMGGRCTRCHRSYYEGTLGASHFMCPECYAWEWSR